MPWGPDDAPSKTKKANTPPKKKQWADTANSVRKRGIAEGQSTKEAEATAVKVANAAVKKHPSKKHR